MTVTNHALAGSLIAVQVQQPLLALPLALLSHFLLDALPHYGYKNSNYQALFKHRLTYVVTGFDLLGIILLIVLLGSAEWYVWLAAILAISPDFMWLYRYIWFERKGLTSPAGTITRFHERIQWLERPWGVFFEIALFLFMLKALGDIL